ncbi:MAG TPA: hypothetical protein VFO29_06785 [Candidatus Rubrimentiphilum sp.]|nr:hypothetical protein [Candidatus Rubrimentiphilum sp.]
MRLLSVLICAVALSISPSVATAQTGASAIAKLQFLTGTWRCVIQGGSSNGRAQHVSYSFSPNRQWMEERSWGASMSDWEVQMWGYDPNRQLLTAYQFTGGGVATKSVGGWINGSFVAKRDDNGATVTLEPQGKRRINWVIRSADGSSTVRELCAR